MTENMACKKADSEPGATVGGGHTCNLSFQKTPTTTGESHLYAVQKNVLFDMSHIKIPSALEAPEWSSWLAPPPAGGGAGTGANRAASVPTGSTSVNKSNKKMRFQRLHCERCRTHEDPTHSFTPPPIPPFSGSPIKQQQQQVSISRLVGCCTTVEACQEMNSSPGDSC